MNTIPQDDELCQEEIPFETGESTCTSDAEPIATPLADFLAASYRREEAAQVFDLVLAIHGDIFYAWDQMVAILAGGDKLDAILAALPEWELEPEKHYFEDEVIT